MKEINFIVKGILKPILKNYSPIIVILRRNWESILGEKYFEFCEPEKVTFMKDKKNDGTIYIKCFNAVISFYIENNKSFILEKINSIFGYCLICNIKIKQEPKIVKQYKKSKIKIENEKVKKSTDNIENDELKNSLKELGNSLFSNN